VRKTTSILGSVLTASSPKAATTTSRTIYRSGSAKPPAGGAPYGDTGENTFPGQHTRQHPAYQKDLVCDRTICGRYKDSTGYRTGRRAKGRGSCEHHANINFCPGGITNEIHAPETKSPSHVSQPRCSLFSYADAVKSRRT